MHYITEILTWLAEHPIFFIMYTVAVYMFAHSIGVSSRLQQYKVKNISFGTKTLSISWTGQATYRDQAYSADRYLLEKMLRATGYNTPHFSKKDFDTIMSSHGYTNIIIIVEDEEPPDNPDN